MRWGSEVALSAVTLRGATGGLFLLLLAAIGGCSNEPGLYPAKRVTADGKVSMVCEQGVTFKDDGTTGICWHTGTEMTMFLADGWRDQRATYYRLTDPSQPALHPAQPKRWKTMEGLDRLIARGEAVLEKWIAEFERAPFTTGLKALLAFIIVRFLYRKLLK